MTQSDLYLLPFGSNNGNTCEIKVGFIQPQPIKSAFLRFVYYIAPNCTWHILYYWIHFFLASIYVFTLCLYVMLFIRQFQQIIGLQSFWGKVFNGTLILHCDRSIGLDLNLKCSIGHPLKVVKGTLMCNFSLSCNNIIWNDYLMSHLLQVINLWILNSNLTRIKQTCFTYSHRRVCAEKLWYSFNSKKHANYAFSSGMWQRPIEQQRSCLRFDVMRPVAAILHRENGCVGVRKDDAMGTARGVSMHPAKAFDRS